MEQTDAVLVSVAGRSSSTRGGEGAAAAGVRKGGGGETGGARQPYLARSLLVGGGVGEGEAEKSPGCSGTRASAEGGCTLGGVEEHLRVEPEPLRDTQVVSITLTPMLQMGQRSIKSREDGCVVQGGEVNYKQILSVVH